MSHPLGKPYSSREREMVDSNSITHFLHPDHKLMLITQGRYTTYTCDLCDVSGNNRRYHCDTCSFDLHECCATYPKTLNSFFAHPWHTLSISAAVGGMNHSCDLCGDRVRGLYYRCNICDFDMHLQCSLLPQTVITAFHPAHPLHLVPNSATCHACRLSTGFWRYTCGLCVVKVHVKCVHTSPAPVPAPATAPAT